MFNDNINLSSVSVFSFWLRVDMLKFPTGFIIYIEEWPYVLRKDLTD